MNSMRSTLLIAALALSSGVGCAVGQNESPIRIHQFQAGSYVSGSVVCDDSLASIVSHASNVFFFGGQLVDLTVESSLEPVSRSTVGGTDYAQPGRNDFIVEEIFRTYQTDVPGVTLPDEIQDLFYVVPEGADRDSDPSCLRTFAIGPAAAAILKTGIAAGQVFNLSISFQLRGHARSGLYLTSNTANLPGRVLNTYSVCEDPSVLCDDVVAPAPATTPTKADVCGSLYCD